jgi:hypothetical protein
MGKKKEGVGGEGVIGTAVGVQEKQKGVKIGCIQNLAEGRGKGEGGKGRRKEHLRAAHTQTRIYRLRLTKSQGPSCRFPRLPRVP